MGMRFSRKSPAVASMERQRPVEDLRDMLEKARVAVVSTGLASAAADGLRTLPARETEIVVGDADGAAMVGAVVRVVGAAGDVAG